MSKLNLEGAKEYTGGALPLGNYIFTIKEFERTKNKNGHRMYVASLEVKEPKHLAGRTNRDWFTVGNDDDPLCKQDETTEDPSNIGAGRLKSLLVKSHTPITNEDEQWMEDAVGNDVGANQRGYKDKQGVDRVNTTYEFAEDVEPGVLDADDGGKQRGKKGPAQAARAARGRRGADDDDLEETTPAKAEATKPTTQDDDDDEDARPRRRRSRRDDDD
jgi:hypothetical protein